MRIQRFTRVCCTVHRWKQPLFKLDYGGHSKQYSGNMALGGGCIHSNIAPRSPHGPEHCHFSSPCADKDPTTLFVGNTCLGSGSNVRCTACDMGVDCATISNNTYYTTGGNGSAVCSYNSSSGGGLEQGSATLPIPPDAELLGMARAALGMRALPPRE